MRLIAMVLLAMLLAGSGSVQAAGPKDVLAQAEATLQLTGTVVVDEQGRVIRHTLDQEAMLEEWLTQFVARQVDRWQFEPTRVDGKPVVAEVQMYLRLVGHREPGDKVRVRIAGTHFGGPNTGPLTDYPRIAQMTPPEFPKAPLRIGGQGIVYLLVQIGRDGRVLNIGVEQTNLRIAGTERQMKMMREDFESAAIRQARHWTFTPPSTGLLVNDESWLIRVPIEFALSAPWGRVSTPGQWDSYIPGPRNVDMPWAADQLRSAGAPDALPAQVGAYPLTQGIKLLTPLS